MLRLGLAALKGSGSRNSTIAASVTTIEVKVNTPGEASSTGIVESLTPEVLRMAEPNPNIVSIVS